MAGASSLFFASSVYRWSERECDRIKLRGWKL